MPERKVAELARKQLMLLRKFREDLMRGPGALPV